MTNAVVFVGAVYFDENSTFKVDGNIFAEGESETIGFQAEGVAFNALAATINAAIRSAAVAAAAAQDVTIGGLGDKLTIFCGAQGL